MKMSLINIKNLRNYMDENIDEHGLETVMNWYEDLVNSFPYYSKIKDVYSGNCFRY